LIAIKPKLDDDGVAKRGLYSGPILTLGAVALIESLAFSLPFSYFPMYAISLGASVASIGLFTSSFMLASALMAPRIGSLSDRTGRKRIILWGLFGDVILGALTGLAPTWYWLLLIRVFNGAMTAAATLPAEALLIDHAPEGRRGEAAGFVMACGMVGRNLGPAIGGVIQFASSAVMSLVDSYRIPYFVDAALAAVAMFLVALKIKEGGDSISVRLSTSRVVKEGSEKIQISRSLKVLFICAFANGIALGFILPVSVLFYQDKFGAEPVEIGFVVSLSGFIGLMASWIAGRISDRLGRKPLIALGVISSRLSGMVIPLTLDLNQATFFMSFRSLGFNISQPAMHALRADIVPPKARGRLFGLYNTFFNAGDIVGPVIATYLYDLYRFDTFNIGRLALPGYGIPFFVNSTIGLLSLAILLIFVKEPKRDAPRES